MQDIQGEFEDALLPDERLIRRLCSFVAAAHKAPSESLPEMLQDAASLEGAYRLVNNPRVEFGALTRPHAQRTAERGRGARDVVVGHDTTSVETPYADREEVGVLNTGRPGYQAHVSLAMVVEPNRPARPLGVLNTEIVCRNADAPKTRRGVGSASSLRWRHGIEASAAALKDCDTVVHVADREADSYPLFSRVIELGHGFVFRIRNDRCARRADDQVDHDWVTLAEIASQMRGIFERTVPLSKRGAKAAPARLKTHPPREARSAVLHYAAAAVELKRPHTQPAALPETLDLTLLRVWEPSPPDGEEPVEWLLLTNEPCQTAAAIMRVVDLYRSRWMLEDFFKALKTGCALESRQLESRHALLNTLAIFIPIAVQLLWLRTCARDTPEAPATDVLTPLQLQVLRHRSHRKLPDNPTVNQALWCLAGLGGHIANNGWPGWQVLGRAFVKLIDAVQTWQLATAAARAEM